MSSDQQAALDETRLLLDSIGSLLGRLHEGPLTQVGIAALLANLCAHVEQLATVAPRLPEPANDQQLPGEPQTGLVSLHESFSGGPDRSLHVARFASRWFVLEGFSSAPLSTYAVHGPYDQRGVALVQAVRLHDDAVKSSRTRLRTVPA